ncbi:protein PIN-LIKES 7-like isoform X2 [Phragmites australis]|uniref:protein PIN-LIKES 7-like isoform X2 n=1 Tax=Phragmites australis TaxID=29695 RepID=UPI002D766622|nr:protein PIN-LIKES 7-like isoform X2 [Phragmites australis]
MRFLSLLALASMPVAEVLLVALAGAYLASACCNILTPTARADINRLVYAVFTPALILASLATTVTLQDAISWWFMLVNIGIIFLVGGVLGWLAVLVLRPPHHLRGLVIASCSAVIPAVCEEHDGNPGPFGNKTICTRRGLSYASFSMALGGFYIWTHTHSVMKRSGQIYRRMKRANFAADATCLVDPPKDDHSAASLSEEEVAQDQVPSCWNKNDEDDVISPSPESVQDKIIMQHQILLPLLSSYRLSGKSNNNLWEKLKEGTLQILEELTAPPTIGAVIGLVVGAVPWLKSVFVGSNAPLRAVHNSLKLLGDGTIPCVTLILGGNLTKGVRKTAVPPAVVAAIIGVRYVILPVTGIVVVKAAREMGFLPPDPLYQYMLMIQFTLPPAMSIGTMAQLYDVGQEECSVIFLWTYLVAALALTVWSTIFMSILLQHP